MDIARFRTDCPAPMGRMAAFALLFWCVAAAGWPERAAAAVWVATGADRPNIVLVIGDDHGWPYYGFMESPQQFNTTGGPVAAHDIAPTPNLDALAAGGVVFTRGYATAPLCVPSLRTLMSASGWHSIQWLQSTDRVREVWHVGNALGDSASGYFRTLPRELSRFGYLSWKGGKMWEGTLAQAGFTHGIEGNLGAAQQFGREGWNVSSCGSTGNPNVPCPALAPLRAFLDEAGEQPFFAWIAPLLPHWPYDAPVHYKIPFAQLGLSPAQVDHLANIRWFDELLGELMREFETRGLLANTLFIYVSDNGWGIDFQTFTGNGRGKGTAYDLGVRTPIIFAGPQGLVPAQYDEPISASDIVATILDFIPGGRAPRDSVGVSLRPRLLGGDPIVRDSLVVHYDHSLVRGDAVLQMPWRYIGYSDGREELYRLDTDPFELFNVAAHHPDRVAAMRPVGASHRGDLLQRPASRAEIFGRVRDPWGAPIAGAQLAYGRGHTMQVVSTDAKGYFVLKTARSDRAMIRPSRRMGTMAWRNAPFVPEMHRTAGVTLEVVATRRSSPLDVPVGGRIVVRVRDEATGQGVAGAAVRTRARSPSVSLRTFTDADGYARVEGLPVGQYIVAVTSRTHRAILQRDVEVANAEDVVNLSFAASPR